MFSFFKKKKQAIDTDIPDWASFFTNEEYVAFLAGIDHYFRAKNVAYTLGDGVIDIDPKIFRFPKLGLSNIAQLCKHHPPEEYTSIIREHFETMLKALERDKAFDEKTASFEEIRPYLGIKLHNQEYITYIGGLDADNQNIVYQYIAEDIYAILIFDLPDATRNVHPGSLANWDKTEDELFQIGMENIRENYPMAVTREDMGSFEIQYINHDHFFTANILFELEKNPDLVGTRGSLIGLPHRHAALIYPIEDVTVAKAVQGLIPAIYSMHKESPDSLTPNLFWYRDGIFTPLPYELREGKLYLMPPDSFMALLSELENKIH